MPKKNETSSNELNFRIVEHIELLYENPSNTGTKEINLVDWGNTGKVKLDIRNWYINSDGVKMPTKKGISLTGEEAELLFNALEDFNFDFDA